MKVNLVADKDYKYTQPCADRLRELGYEVEVHPIPEVPEKLTLPFGQTINGITYTPKSQWKPYWFKEQINYGDVFYMDADTFMLERVDELFENKVTLTTHQPPKPNAEGFDHITGRLNAGVIYIEKCFEGIKFIDEWMKAMPLTKSGSDQEALHMIMDLPFVTHVPTSIYNADPKSKDAKIIHYKGQWKKYYDKA